MAHFSEEIDEVVQSAVKPRILILGAGHLREADNAIQSARLHHAQFVALVQEASTSEVLRSTYRQHPLQVETGNWTDFSGLRDKLGTFDFIYSPHWLDWCDDRQAASWLRQAVEMLKAGGRLLAANSTAGSPDAGRHPHFRSEEQLAELIAELKTSSVRGHAVFRDPDGDSVFLEGHSL